MRPVPVPDWLRDADWVKGTAVFAAPGGDLTSEQIPPAEGVFYSTLMLGFGDRQFPMVGVVLRLDDDDFESIIAGTRHILLSWPGSQMPVFIVPELLREVPLNQEANDG